MTTEAARASGLSPALAEEQPLLSLRGINKSFGAIHVLKNVDFDCWAGKVTSLVGDNGAGKSTLIKGVAGIYPFDSGEYRFRYSADGEWYTDYASNGIEMVDKGVNSVLVVPERRAGAAVESRPAKMVA